MLSVTLIGAGAEIVAERVTGVPAGTNATPSSQDRESFPGHSMLTIAVIVPAVMFALCNPQGQAKSARSLFHADWQSVGKA
jgi:hypothetical protein